MTEEIVTTESENVRGRWIRYVHTDPNSGRQRISVTQIVEVDVTYARPNHFRDLDDADKQYVDWLMNQDGTGQISQIDFLTLSPEELVKDEDPTVMVNVPYSALGKPSKVVQFSLATVKEVLTEINRVAKQHPEKKHKLIESYHLSENDGILSFYQR